MSQILQYYQNLRNSESVTDDLGCTLPPLHAASLSIRNHVGALDEIIKQLASWYSASGWYQTSGCTALGIPETATDLLEGEWYDGKNTSFSMRLIGPNQYQMTEITIKDSDRQEIYCYQDQYIKLRGNLCTDKVNVVRYRQWFEQKDHAWQAIVSQFIGFDFI